MTTYLPSRPDLGHLKRQAKSLLKAQQQGDAGACSVLRQLHRFSRASDADILASEVKLNEVQFALALDYGFTSWNALKHHVERIAVTGNEATVRRRDGEVWIDGVPRLSWSDPGGCTFIGALLRALNKIGEPVSYTDLMGISGAAFRFCFTHPNWDWSSVDGMLGYDHGQTAMDALGYEAGWAEEDEMRAAFMRSIDEGRPALGIDLVRAAEWGVITGYADEGKTLLCRTYFDDPGDAYMRTERLPWLNYLIGARRPAPTRRESLLASLRVAVTYARGGSFVSGGGMTYTRGIEALETWIADLQDEPRFDPSDADGFVKHASINRFIFDALLDARGAAASYLATHSEVLGPDFQGQLTRLAGIYGRMTAGLRECVRHVPSDEGLDPQGWTLQMRRAQVDALRGIVALERESLEVCERIISSA